MKSKITSLALFVFLGISSGKLFSQGLTSSGYPGTGSGQNVQTTIDVNDTIVFDLAQSITAGNTVEFPLYFLSDDTINAIDFSMKFNQANFAYDTTISLITSLQVMAYFNTADSTLRFTSNSIQPVNSNTPMVNIRFTVLSGQLCSSDLNDIITYLNGDFCTSKIMNCVANGISDPEDHESLMQVYPDPADAFINIHADQKMKIFITDARGSIVKPQTTLSENELLSIETSGFSPGVYFIHTKGERTSSTEKIIITR